ncbi:MAG: hypothetical protein PHS73_01620 [Candidatus Peribacteraceae bacterium]|nr:hypothetical protein [Candidatus Peribacteraceae bacterium]
MELNPAQQEELERFRSLVANVEASGAELQTRESILRQVESAYKNYFRTVAQIEEDGNEPVEQSVGIPRTLYVTCTKQEVKGAPLIPEMMPALAGRMETVRALIMRAFAEVTGEQHEIPRTILHLLLMPEKIAEETGLDVSIVRSCLAGIVQSENKDPSQNILNDGVLARFHEVAVVQFYGAMLKKGYSVQLAVPADLDTPADGVQTETPEKVRRCGPSDISIIATRDQIEIVTDLQDEEIERYRDVIDAATVIRQRYGDPHHDEATEYADKYDVHAQIEEMVRERFGVSIDDAGEGTDVATTRGDSNTPEPRWEQPQLSPEQADETAHLLQVIDGIGGDDDVKRFLSERAAVAVDNYYFMLEKQATDSAAQSENSPSSGADTTEAPGGDKTLQMLHALYVTAFNAEMEFYQQNRGRMSRENLTLRLERIHKFVQQAAQQQCGGDAKIPYVIGHLAVMSGEVSARDQLNPRTTNQVIELLVGACENPHAEVLSPDLNAKVQKLLVSHLVQAVQTMGFETEVHTEEPEKPVTVDSQGCGSNKVIVVYKTDGTVQIDAGDAVRSSARELHTTRTILENLEYIFRRWGEKK